MTVSSTRSQTEHTLFGHAAELPQNVIPTGLDIIKSYLYHLQEGTYQNSIHKRAEGIAIEVKEIYNKAGIPMIQMSSIAIRIKRLISEMNELNKHSDDKKSSQTFQDKMKSFANVFDVCCCKCFDNGLRSRDQCKCPLPMKIPHIE